MYDSYVKCFSVGFFLFYLNSIFLLLLLLWMNWLVFMLFWVKFNEFKVVYFENFNFFILDFFDGCFNVFEFKFEKIN